MIQNSVLRKFFSLALMFLPMLHVAFAQQLVLTMNFSIKGGDHGFSKISIARNGSPWKLIRPAKSTQNETLEFGNNYLLTFEKPGFSSRQVSVSTANVPTNVQTMGLAVSVNVELATEANGGDWPPLIRYAYDPAARGIVMEKPAVTAAQIKEERLKAEETYNLITKEEEKEIQYNKHFVKEDALEGRKGEGSTKKEKELTEEQKQAQEDKKAAAIKAAEDARAAQLALIEEQRKATMAKATEKEKEAQAEREEEQRKQIATIKAAEEQRKAVELKTAAAAREAEAARAEEERRRQEAAAKAEQEKRRREAREKYQQEQRNKTQAPAAVAEEKPMTIAEAGNIVSRTEEIIQEEKRIIKQITIKRERHTFVYRMVKYDWGGIYYFKNDMDMTKLDFDSETALTK